MQIVYIFSKKIGFNISYKLSHSIFWEEMKERRKKKQKKWKKEEKKKLKILSKKKKKKKKWIVLIGLLKGDILHYVSTLSLY